MAEKPDKDSKTEQPTEKKIYDAVEGGNVPVSREVTIFFFPGRPVVDYGLFSQQWFFKDRVCTGAFARSGE